MKLTALALVLDLAACYRLTRLVVADTFPPIAYVRDRIVRKHTRITANPGGGYTEEPGPLAELVQCPWCASVWVGAAIALAQWRIPGVWLWVSLALALSAVAGVVSQLVDE